MSVGPSWRRTVLVAAALLAAMPPPSSAWVSSPGATRHRRGVGGPAAAGFSGNLRSPGSAPLRTRLAAGAASDREREIRRKIAALKRQGRIRKRKKSSLEQELDDDDGDEVAAAPTDYADKVRQKLGSTKSRVLGFSGDEGEGEGEDEEDLIQSSRRRPQIGASLGDAKTSDDDSVARTGGHQRIQHDGGPFSSAASAFSEVGDDDDEDDDDDGVDMTEEDLVEMVAQKMQEKRYQEQREKEAQLKRQAREKLAKLEEERRRQQQSELSSSDSADDPKRITTGVGGSWNRSSGGSSKATEDIYQPKTGSWGAFPRPRDISKAYGGGRRIGPGYSKEQLEKSAEETRAKLQRYREKVGIDVESEKIHAAEIEEALQIASLAMQRGVYSTAVSALEKITRYCSTNSKVGGKVFLELAMAYEAVGRTSEAIKVYTALTKCRIEEIKFNAKRLLYGIEAMQFMQENVKSSEFSRKKASAAFIDATGLDTIASKFDDVYETAYIDLDKGFYKKLTESVVRSPREARQILLKATGPGEVERLRIVQALRSLARKFDDALQAEIERSAPVEEPAAVMNGKPILVKERDDDLSRLPDMDGFVLADAEQMMTNLGGEWRLQLIADKRGDGVKFFNSTAAWQRVDTDRMSFTAVGPAGFSTVQQEGKFEFNEKRRVLRRKAVDITGGGGMFLSGLFGGKRTTGAYGIVREPQQVVSVDEVLLVTRGVPSFRSRAGSDDDKDYFGVWRRVELGTFSRN